MSYLIRNGQSRKTHGGLARDTQVSASRPDGRPELEIRVPAIDEHVVDPRHLRVTGEATNTRRQPPSLARAFAKVARAWLGSIGGAPRRRTIAHPVRRYACGWKPQAKKRPTTPVPLLGPSRVPCHALVAPNEESVMALRALRPEEVPSAIWLQKPPPLCTGVETCIYRGVQSNVRLIPAQFRPACGFPAEW